MKYYIFLLLSRRPIGGQPVSAAKQDSFCPHELSGITCLPFPEQACIQLVTGPLHCRNCGKAFSSPKCELSYRLLPWNPEMENFVGAPTGIEPVSPAFQAGVLTNTPQHPGTKCIKFASSNHPWQMVLQHDVITTVFTHCESATYTVVQAILS